MKKSRPSRAIRHAAYMRYMKQMHILGWAETLAAEHWKKSGKTRRNWIQGQIELQAKEDQCADAPHSVKA